MIMMMEINETRAREEIWSFTQQFHSSFAWSLRYIPLAKFQAIFGNISKATNPLIPLKKIKVSSSVNLEQITANEGMTNYDSERQEISKLNCFSYGGQSNFKECRRFLHVPSIIWP